MQRKNAFPTQKQATRAVRAWHKKYSFLDKFIAVAAVILLGVLRPDALMIGAFIVVHPYLLLTKRTALFRHLYLAAALALTWVLVTNHYYSYAVPMARLAGLNTYPLFAWTLGLFATYFLFMQWDYAYQRATPWKRFTLFTAFYWFLLLGMETIAFHSFGITNVVTSTYPGLPLCDCLHAPPWMQTAYLAMGPLYYGLCTILGLHQGKQQKRS